MPDEKPQSATGAPGLAGRLIPRPIRDAALKPMPERLVEIVRIVLRAAIVFGVVGWILDIAGRMGIAIFTESMLAAILGLSLALAFLSFPLSMDAIGEEAIAKQMLEGETVRAGWLDGILAAAALIACFYVAIRYPELVREL
jgi:TRAP-type uncharacterized transport system fused permease subunit